MRQLGLHRSFAGACFEAESGSNLPTLHTPYTSRATTAILGRPPVTATTEATKNPSSARHPKERTIPRAQAASQNETQSEQTFAWRLFESGIGMLNIQQIESLRSSNPQLYEALRRIAGASLGPNQGWSLDDQIADGTNYARVASGALTAGNIDPSKSGVLMKGSVPPTWSGSFTYASTASSLTWWWSGLSIFRADGTTTAIPDGSVAVTGLAAGTTYYFYPYWDDTSGAIGWVAGASGAPGYAQPAKTNSAAQQQALQGRVPLSQGAVVAATTASGTGGGSGGGSGSCLRSGTMVLTKERGTVAIETCAPGEHLRCPSAAGSEAWTSIVRLETRDADTFIRLYFSNAESLDVTPHHIFTLADGSPMRAERLCLCDVLVGRFGRLTLKKIEVIVEPAQKVTVSCEPMHQFFAGRHTASILTHNYTFSS